MKEATSGELDAAFVPWFPVTTHLLESDG